MANPLSGFLALVASRKRKLTTNIADFLADNSDCLVIVCDPKTDVVVVGHKGKIVPGRISKQNGKSLNLISDLLRGKDMQGNIDKVLLYIDGAMYNLIGSLKHGEKWGTIKAKELSDAEKSAETSTTHS